MITTTLDRGLRKYGIGAKLRALRLKKSLGLTELGRHTGLSAAMLSKLERGKLHPTLPTLLRIAMVYGVGLDYFFSEPKRPASLVTNGERQRLAERLGTREVQWEYECLDFNASERRLNAYWARFAATRGRLALHRHPGSEFIHLLQGELLITVADEEFVLRAGDSLYFDAGQPHGYRRQGSTACEAILVTVPA